MEPKKTEQQTFRWTSNSRKRLEAIAKRDNRTTAALCRIYVLEGIKRDEGKIKAKTGKPTRKNKN